MFGCLNQGLFRSDLGFTKSEFVSIRFGCLLAILMSAFDKAKEPTEEENKPGGGAELARKGKFTVGEQVHNCFARRASGRQSGPMTHDP